MNDWLIGLILLPIALAETGELAPWLARRCLDWGARRLTDQQERERYAEEWRADLERVPGKVTKLGYAATVVLLAVPQLRWRTRRREREVPGMRAAAGRAAAALGTVGDVNTLANLIASGLVCSLGFRGVAVNLTTGDGRLRCTAAIGPQEMVDLLLGTDCARSPIDELLSQGTPWGTMRFVNSFPESSDELPVYTPDTPSADGSDPNLWRPEYGLLAPMYAPTGEMLGMLSLDDPASGCLPGPAHRAALEAFVAHAAARLSDLRRQIEPPSVPTTHR